MDDLYEKFEKFLEKETKMVSYQDWVSNLRQTRGQKVMSRNCKDCLTELTIVDSVFLCTNCGVIQSYTNSCNYIKKTQSYKRMTHFKDWLTKTQAKHNPMIPDHIISQCRQIQDKSYRSIKNVLKINNLTKIYEDIWYIMAVVDQKADILCLDPHDEMKLYNLFMRVQRAWETIKPLKRKSIISYPFIITELLDIIKRPELKRYFHLPRYTKILEYKTQWKRIINSRLFYHATLMD